MRSFIVGTILVFIVSTTVFGQKYQTSFYVENRFKNEVKIPAVALKVLEKTEEVQRCVKADANLNFSADWFRSAKINLNNDRLPDLIVEQNFRCLSAPSRQPYWILLNKSGKYELLLMTYTFGLYINRERTKGLFNITIDWATSNTLYKTTFGFDGRKYKALAEKEKPSL